MHRPATKVQNKTVLFQAILFPFSIILIGLSSIELKRYILSKMPLNAYLYLLLFRSAQKHADPAAVIVRVGINNHNVFSPVFVNIKTVHVVDPVQPLLREP